LTKTRDRCSNVNKHGTDGQTDRQSATQYAAPSYGGGPHKNWVLVCCCDDLTGALHDL